MDHSKFTLFLLFSVVSFHLSGQGIEFLNGDWSLALEMAKEQDKHIVVDMHTAWCSPCKRMDREVFSQPEVGSYVNENFIALKTDAEQDSLGAWLKDAYGVHSFPTYLFFNAEGTWVHRGGAYRPVDDFLALCKEALDPSRQLVEIQQAAREQNAGKHEATDYFFAAGKAGLAMTEPMRFIAPYLDSSFVLEHWNEISSMQVPFTSKLYGLVAEMQDTLEKLSSSAHVNGFLFFPRHKFVMRNAFSSDTAHLNESLALVDSLLPHPLSEEVQHQLRFHWTERHDTANLSEVRSLYLLNWCKQPYEFEAAARKIAESRTMDSSKLAEAIDWCELGLKFGPNLDIYATLAWLHHLNGSPDEARDYARLSVELGAQFQRESIRAQNLLSKLNEEIVEE